MDAPSALTLEDVRAQGKQFVGEARRDDRFLVMA